ncbi:hypothetical protein WA556_001942 [Blastocystis sp. ATCC 50177/Nand II]
MVFALLPTDFLVEWRGFGTDEDDQYLASLHFQARGDSMYPSSPYYTGPSHLDYTSFGPENTDFQDMRADDAIFDSYNMDFSQLHWELPSHPSAPSVPSQPEKGRSWRDVVGTEFAHPPIPPPPTPAREEPEEEVTPKSKDKKKEVCRYWLNGNCMYGDRCWYAHTNEPEKKPAQLEYSTECCICQEDVLKANKRFGLMQNCNHVFCLECIRNWRYSHIGDPNVRRCPLCRATSFYVIPSNVPIFDQDVKDQIIEMYKKNMSKIPCKHFNGGFGVCPFGDSCFYSHKLANGQDFTSRMVMQADGELRDIGYSHSLGDCIVMKTKQDKRKKRVKRKIEGDNWSVC